MLVEMASEVVKLRRISLNNYVYNFFKIATLTTLLVKCSLVCDYGSIILNSSKVMLGTINER